MEVRFPCSICRRLPLCQRLVLSNAATCIFPYVRHASTQHPRQANPLGDYYESLLSQPYPSSTSSTRQPTTLSPPISPPKADIEETLAKARVVFGSRLAGPA